MKSKITAGILGAALAIGVPLFAQNAVDSGQANSATTQTAPYGHRHGKGMKKLAEKLNLTQDQQAKLKPIFQQSRTQAKTIREDASLTQDQKKAKFKELHENTMAQVNGILTPDQQEQWKQLREQRRAQWQQRKQQQSAPQAAPQG